MAVNGFRAAVPHDYQEVRRGSAALTWLYPSKTPGGDAAEAMARESAGCAERQCLADRRVGARLSPRRTGVRSRRGHDDDGMTMTA